MLDDIISGVIKGLTKAIINSEDDLTGAAVKGAENEAVKGLIKDGASFIGTVIFGNDDKNDE